MREATIALTLAGITFLLTVIWGLPFITILRRYKIGKKIRIDGPESHQVKMGTPTMGGLMIVGPVLTITAFINIVSLLRRTDTGLSVLLPLGVLTAYTVLGAYDDWLGLQGVSRGEGMRGRALIVWQTALAIAAAVGLYRVLGLDLMFLPSVPFPFHLDWWLYLPVAAFVIVSSTNAVNLTDGLDGLAGLISATAFAAYGLIALLQNQVFLARFCFILVGAVFAFLWFNAHPAQMMMGGSGSYSLGAVLAVVALMTGQWLLFPLIAIIPVSVALSVILQVSYFKLTRRLTGTPKRLFRMAPLHHHFEMLGWSETQVVQRFWLVQLLAVMIGVGLALL
jgi:phospho-N-acetylmuramoyl-pentapeptide-transferase